MKRSTKVLSIVIIFFLIIATVIIGRTMIGNHFKKKFSKRPPPGIVVTEVIQEDFSEKISSFGTAVSKKTETFRIKKNELNSELKLEEYVNKGDLIVKLKDKSIVAPFNGVLGYRGLTDDVLGSDNSIIITLDDSSIIYCDLKIPENYASSIKKGLRVDVKFSGNKDKTYNGIVDSLASKIDVSNRSLRLRVKMQNSNSEILPGALMEVTIKYNERVSLGIPDTSVILEGNKVYIYKVDNENVTKRVEVTVGNRNKGYLEVESGLNEGDIVVAEGLKKVRPNGKIKPIKDGEKKSDSSWGIKENKSK